MEITQGLYHLLVSVTVVEETGKSGCHGNHTGKIQSPVATKGGLPQGEDVEVVGRWAFDAWGLSAYQGLEVRPRWSGQSDPRPVGRRPSCAERKPQGLLWHVVEC